MIPNMNPNSGCEWEHDPDESKPIARHLYNTYRDYVYEVLNGHICIGSICGEDLIESVKMTGDQFIEQTALIMANIRQMKE